MTNSHQKADKITEQLVIGITDALNGNGEDGLVEMDLRNAIGPDGDVTAFFEGLLMTTAYFYRQLSDGQADLLDVVDVMNRLMVARIVDQQNK